LELGYIQRRFYFRLKLGDIKSRFYYRLKLGDIQRSFYFRLKLDIYRFYLRLKNRIYTEKGFKLLLNYLRLNYDSSTIPILPIPS